MQRLPLFFKIATVVVIIKGILNTITIIYSHSSTLRHLSAVVLIVIAFLLVIITYGYTIVCLFFSGSSSSSQTSTTRKLSHRLVALCGYLLLNLSAIMARMVSLHLHERFIPLDMVVNLVIGFEGLFDACVMGNVLDGLGWCSSACCGIEPRSKTQLARFCQVVDSRVRVGESVVTGRSVKSVVMGAGSLTLEASRSMFFTPEEKEMEERLRSSLELLVSRGGGGRRRSSSTCCCCGSSSSQSVSHPP